MLKIWSSLSYHIKAVTFSWSESILKCPEIVKITCTVGMQNKTWSSKAIRAIWFRLEYYSILEIEQICKILLHYIQN